MRVGEAVGLDRDDVDLRGRGHHDPPREVRPPRLVPLHPTVTEALSRYAAERDRLCPRPRARAFFVSSVGTRLDRSGVAKTLRQITTALGMRTDDRPPAGT